MGAEEGPAGLGGSMGKWWLAVAVVVMTAGCSPGVDDRPALQTSESTTTTTTTTVEEDP